MKMDEVARLSGVSKSTVSRVINDPDQVRPHLVERVQQVLRETGYTPNLLAKALVTKQSRLVGIVMPQIGNDTFAAIVDGITHVLEQHGYNLLLATSRDNPDKELLYFDVFNKKQVDGIISFPSILSEGHLEFFKATKLPMVLLNQADPAGKIPAILYDDFHSAHALVKYLLDLGHRRIAYIGVEKQNASVDQARRAGYMAAMAERGLFAEENLIVQGDFSLEHGYHGMETIWLRMNNKPTAVFAATDRLAMAAAQYLREQGCNVPEDVSIVGVDDMDISRTANPPLTTIHYDYYHSGEMAAELLIKQIQQPEEAVTNLTVAYELKVRGSTRKI